MGGVGSRILVLGFDSDSGSGFDLTVGVGSEMGLGSGLGFGIVEHDSDSGFAGMAEADFVGTEVDTTGLRFGLMVYWDCRGILVVATGGREIVVAAAEDEDGSE